MVWLAASSEISNNNNHESYQKHSMLILHICLRMLAGSRHMHLSIMVTLCQSKVEPWLIRFDSSSSSLWLQLLLLQPRLPVSGVREKRIKVVHASSLILYSNITAAVAISSGRTNIIHSFVLSQLSLSYTYDRTR
jgi:hypothetical protein